MWFEFPQFYVDEESHNLSKILLFLYVIFSLVFCGGNVFGFTPLKEILLDEGVYSELCADSSSSGPCEDQLSELDKMFTLAASLFSAYLLPAGVCVRQLGPRWSFLTGFGFVALGSWGMAHLPPKYYTFLYVLIGTGNPLIYIASFNFTKIYPSSTNLLLSVCIGCFGFSSIIFYFFHLLYFSSLGWSSHELFKGFTAVPLCLALVGFWILPPYPYHIQMERKHASLDPTKSTSSEPDSVPTEKTPLNASKVSPSIPEVDDDTTKVDDTDNPTIPLKERSILQQLQSAPFLAQTLFFCWGMLHQNFYLGTIGDQIYGLAGDDEDMKEIAVELLSNFSWAYPVGCLMALLPVGTLVRTQSVTRSLWCYCVTNLVFATLSWIPVARIQFITAALYVVVRVGFFTIMSTYSATLFGFANMSTLFGSAGCMAGLVSLGGSLLSDRALHVDHTFFYVNGMFWIGGILTFGLPLALARHKWETP